MCRDRDQARVRVDRGHGFFVSPIDSASPQRPTCHALLDDDDVDHMLEGLEIVSVARVEGKLGRERRRCDEQVDRSPSPRPSSCGNDGSEDAAVGACSVGIER